MIKRNKTFVLFSFLALLVSLAICVHIYKRNNRTILFPNNTSGKATELKYDKDFSRIDAGEQVVSIAQYGDGFFGAYYSKLLYFNQMKRLVETVSVPKGFYGLSDVVYNKMDNNLIWYPTGIYYDKDVDLLYVANYIGHNILICNVELIDGSPVITVKDTVSYDGMESPENVCSKNGIIAVADYDGNALWILDTEGGLEKKIDVRLAHGVTISSDAIFVTSLYDRKIYKYSYEGDLICEVGHEAYEGRDSFMWPTGLDATDTEIIVADAHTSRIYLYDHNLNYLSSIGGLGPSDNALHYPYCANYIDGCIYISDTFNGRIVILGVDGKIKCIWGHEISGIDQDLIYHQTSDIPYTYGKTNEISSQIINPYLKSDILLGYGSLWFENSDNTFMMNMVDYNVNEEFLLATIPRLTEFYTMWVKRIEIEGRIYYVFGSPENSGQIFVYNDTDNIFFIEAVDDIKSIWYLEGKWYCEKDVDNSLITFVMKSTDSQKKYLELINSGCDKRQAYKEAFLDYYNRIYANVLENKMSEDTFYLWVESFFSTNSGREFWENYSNDPVELQKLTMDYFKSTQCGGSNICESLMVRMLGEIENND